MPEFFNLNSKIKAYQYFSTNDDPMSTTKKNYGNTVFGGGQEIKKIQTNFMGVNRKKSEF